MAGEEIVESVREPQPPEQVATGGRWVPALPDGGNRRLSPAEWTKLLFPLIVLLIYAGGQAFRGAMAPRPAKPVDEARSLTGISPESDTLKLTKEGRILVTDLERLAARDDWAAVARRAGAAPPPLRDHVIVRGFALLSRARTGERGASLEREIASITSQIPRGGESGALREQLDMAHALSILDRCNSLELLMANAETLQRLAEGTQSRPSVLDVRVRVAKAYERHADQRTEASIKVTSNDIAGLREARGLYQTALRWLVDPSGWIALAPRSDSLRPHIERIVGKMQRANKALHPFDLPFTDQDRNTWTGRKGDPIHDAPAVSR